MAAYFVKVARRGVSPLKVELLVRADSTEEAAGLASVIAERDRGGVFEAERVRPAPKPEELLPPEAFDDSG